MDLNVIWTNFGFMVGGLVLTFQLTGITLIGALFFGTLLALARLSSRFWLFFPATLWVHFFRGLPLILVIFWIYFLFPVIVGKAVGPFYSAIVAFILFESAYFCEIIRAGIQSVPNGQRIAAFSAGLTPKQAFVFVILPQAIRHMLPSLVNQSVIIFQDTSLAYVIGLREFFRKVSLVDAREARSIELYLFAGLIYFVICSAGSLMSRKLEKKWRIKG